MMTIKDEVATLKRGRRVTVELEPNEYLMSFKDGAYYRLGGQVEDAPDDNTSPHPTQRQPLTDEETKLLWHKARFCMGSNRWTVFKNLIEAAHNIKEST